MPVLVWWLSQQQIFISALVVTHGCLQYLRGLTISLQEVKDIVQAMSEINTVASSLKKVRENVDSFYGKYFETIATMCRNVRITASIPRTCGHQGHRTNTLASNPSHYYITIPILDHILLSLTDDLPYIIRSLCKAYTSCHR